MKTPVWLFDNDWFKDTTYMFSGVSIGIMTALTIFESMKRMASGLRGNDFIKVGKAMDFKTILKRWFLAAGLTTIAPALWRQGFRLLNSVSDTLIRMGASNMQGVALTGHMAAFDVAVMLAFDAVLIGTIVPVLWQNGRRFFDLIVLGILTPLALVAWIFDGYRGLFNQWWGQVKHLSLVQVYHAIFLLVLGWFIFGVGTPTTFTGLVIKTLVVIGGFARMTNPPQLIAKHLDSGGDVRKLTGNGKSAFKKTKENYALSKALLGGPAKAIKFLATKGGK